MLKLKFKERMGIITCGRDGVGGEGEEGEEGSHRNSKNQRVIIIKLS